MGKTVKVNLELHDDRYDTSVPDPEDRWDRASTHTDWFFGGLRRVDDDKALTYQGSDVFEIPAEWEGCAVSVVWIVWSTGDSFGYDENHYAEGIGIYIDPEEAYKVKQLIEDDNRKGFSYDNKGNQVTLPSGQVLYTGSWKGYFENLTGVYIDTVVVP